MREALKLALEHIEGNYTVSDKDAITAIKEALAQPEQKPVAWLTEERYAQLHTAQRTWVGLTDEEIDKTHETKIWDARRSYARAIEAKLKEKNT